MVRSAFLAGAAQRLVTGPRIYYVWVGSLFVLALAGLGAYAWQIKAGLVVTGLTSYVPWGLYIGQLHVSRGRRRCGRCC